MYARYLQINNVLSTLKPRKSVVFAFDGSAPLAKLLTQRSRREENRRADRYGLSALHLTPGTAFMDMMTESMRYYAFMRLGATVSYMHVTFMYFELAPAQLKTVLKV
jgi:5'-3' exonuclease